MTISYRDVKIIILNVILSIIKIYMYTNHKEYENNEKSNDDIYQLAKNHALVKK